MNAVIDDRAAGRFEIAVDGQTAFAAYRREQDRVIFTHTIVPTALGGRGVGSHLVQGALDRVRAEGLTVVPECSFVADYIERHPDYRDLLAV